MMCNRIYNTDMLNFRNDDQFFSCFTLDLSDDFTVALFFPLSSLLNVR